MNEVGFGCLEQAHPGSPFFPGAGSDVRVRQVCVMLIRKCSIKAKLQ